MHPARRTTSVVVGLTAGLVLSACANGAVEESARTVSPSPTSSSSTAAGSPTTSAATPSSPTPELPAELARAVADGPVEATSPRQAVAQVVAAERAIADQQTRPEVLAAAGHLQQVAYRVLGRHPGWDEQVRRMLPKGLTGVVEDNVAARRELRSMHPTDRAELSDELPAWRIVAPPPRRRLMAAYREAEQKFGVPWTYLASINLVETVMGRIRGTSVAGAQGPMQFMPPTWEAYGKGDVHDPHDAILGAGRYLQAMGFAEDRETALRRYNNHPAYVRAVTLVAEVMERRPRAFHGYYGWQVYYLTSKGSIHLPEGYAAERPVPVERWLARHPAG